MIFAPGNPHRIGLFSCLLRNRTAPFPHALRCLSAGNAFPAVRAVFDAVRGGSERSPARGTTLFIPGLEKLGIQELIKGKYGNPKPLAQEGIGNKLRAYALVPVVKQDTMSVIAVAALPAHKGIDFPALWRRKPLNLAHTSSAA